MHTEDSQLVFNLADTLKAGLWFLATIIPMWIWFCNWLTGL